MPDEAAIIMLIKQFNPIIEHTAGSVNKVADADHKAVVFTG